MGLMGICLEWLRGAPAKCPRWEGEWASVQSLVLWKEPVLEPGKGGIECWD